LTPLLNIVGSSVALLAFVVAFYALLAREKKTPYITNYIFPPAALIFFAVFLVLIEQLLQGLRSGFTSLLASPAIASQAPAAHIPRIDYVLILGAYGCLGFGALRIFLSIWRLHNRQVNFRDDNALKNMRLVRRCRNWLRRLSSAPSYEHSPAEINNETVRVALEISGFGIDSDTRKEQKIRTLAICGYSLRETDKIVSMLASELLKEGWLVQYTSCIRHPNEWVAELEEKVGPAFSASASRISVVDAYTPHFGFADSIHSRETDKVTSLGVVYVASPESYAGVHTATAKAFNAQKKRKAPGVVRGPTLLIYEGCRALVDLESCEQYRVFLRHVLTSERMWGGMLTVFLEPEAVEADIALIATYADFVKCEPVRGKVKDVKSEGS
jgi:hypothetical protein